MALSLCGCLDEENSYFDDVWVGLLSLMGVWLFSPIGLVLNNNSNHQNIININLVFLGLLTAGLLSISAQRQQFYLQSNTHTLVSYILLGDGFVCLGVVLLVRQTLLQSPQKKVEEKERFLSDSYPEDVTVS